MSLVTVITPTFNRHDLLLNRCIPSVQNQTYPCVEHVVVADGPDQGLREKVPFSVKFLELDQNANDWGATPRRMGVQVANGDYIAFLDDDNEYLSCHVEDLVGLLERDSADIAFSQQMRYSRHHGQGILGNGSVVYGGIDTSMLLVRRQAFQIANWREAGYSNDWDIISRWKDAGLKFTFLPKVTSNYYLRGGEL